MVIVSAVIPTRGRPELLRRAVRSALAQTLRDIEVVVVIDGRILVTRASWKKLAQQDGRLRVLALGRPAWVDRTRVTGASMRRRENGLRFWMTTTNGFRVSSRPSSMRCAHRRRRSLIGTCRMIARTPGRDYVWPRRMPAGDEQIGEYILARRTLTRGEGYIQTSTFFVRRSLMLAQPFKSGQLKHQDTEWVLRMGRVPGTQVVFAERCWRFTT
jgi:glycosyltransferase involved in cell wall biosynthesis